MGWGAWEGVDGDAVVNYVQLTRATWDLEALSGLVENIMYCSLCLRNKDTEVRLTQGQDPKAVWIESGLKP